MQKLQIAFVLTKEVQKQKHLKRVCGANSRMSERHWLPEEKRKNLAMDNTKEDALLL